MYRGGARVGFIVYEWETSETWLEGRDVWRGLACKLDVSLQDHGHVIQHHSCKLHKHPSGKPLTLQQDGFQVSLFWRQPD